MARLNLRLACSIGAAGILAVIALVPATRPLMERQFRILAGTRDKETRDPGALPEMGGTWRDAEVVQLLRGNGEPAENRAFAMSSIAEKQNNPALWAHTIRFSSVFPFALSQRKTPWDRLAGHRRNALGDVEYMAAKEGQRLDPGNLFFYLAEASGLAKMDRWEEIAPALEKGAKCTRFNDYTIDEFKRKTEYLASTSDPLLTSDMGNSWAGITFPHYSSYRNIGRHLNVIRDPKDRFRAGLALAEIGRFFTKLEHEKLLSLVGGAMTKGVIARLASDAEKLEEQKIDFDKSLATVITKAEPLGLSDQFRTFQGWKFTPPQWPAVDVSLQYESADGARAIYLLVILCALGMWMWFWSGHDPSAKNIWTATGAMAGVTTLCAATVESTALIWPLVLAWCAIFAGFLLSRLPGKQRVGYVISLLGLLAIGAQALWRPESSAAYSFVGIWVLPFGLNWLIKKPLPKWVGIGAVTILLGLAFYALGVSSARTPESFANHLSESSATLVILATVWIPWTLALLMSTLKLNLPDSLKVLSTPLPLYALITMGFFAWTIRDAYQWEKLWQETIRQELPDNYKRVLAELGIND